MEEKTDNFELERAMGFYVSRTAYVMSEAVEKRFRSCGYKLSVQDFGILFRLWKQDGLSQVQSAHLMMSEKTTITRRLDALVKKGLIERKVDLSDRRLFRIHLTKEGVLATERLMVVVDQFQKEVLVNIPGEHKEITISTLKKIIGHLTRSRA